MNDWQATTRGRKAPVAIGIISFALSAALSVPCGATAGDLQPVPPRDATVVREVQAGGAQIYECSAAADGTFAWILLGPKALLINADGSDFGTHTAGPTWTATDGSSIAGDGMHPLAKMLRPQSVPALLLRVTAAHGSGVLSDVRFIRRADTEGGLPPTNGCDAAHLNASVASHYSAVYTFYR